jgi:DNA repair exonuclease SbcCD ATPase subunit
MSLRVIPIFLWACCATLVAQDTAPAPAARPGAQRSDVPRVAVESSGASEDIFEGLRLSMEREDAIYKELDAKSLPQIDALLKTRRCQFLRIGGLLDRMLVALNNYETEALKYWGSWGDVERQRVDGQIKTLASLEASLKRDEEMIARERDEHEDLLRRRVNLEKGGKRTEDIIKQIDELIADIKDSEERLNKAQASFEDSNARLSAMKDSISARLVKIRQNKDSISAYCQQMRAYYEHIRVSAQEVCNAKAPDTKRTPQPAHRDQN